MTSVYSACPILVVDDDDLTLACVKHLLELENGEIANLLLCSDPREAMRIIESRELSLLLLDLGMPEISGETIIEWVMENHPHLPVIVITGTDSVDKAVTCMRQGVFDYLVKPLKLEVLVASVNRALAFGELRRHNSILRRQMLSSELGRPEVFARIVTRNEKMRQLFGYAEAIAHTTQPVLITGETGTGKELIARAVNTLSDRKGRFVAVNVAGLDDNLFSDNLFGHVPGAYTGADRARDGLIEKAAGGTLFLDEVGDLSPASQVKLLRLLQEQEYFPLGADWTKRTDARVIVATNHNIETLQSSGKFRKDLFYRLQTHHMHVPPLRERMCDLPLLVDHFLDKCASALGKARPHAPPELIPLLETYSFPGNVRELEAMIFDAVSRHRSHLLSLGTFRDRISKNISSLRTQSFLTSANPFAEVATLPTLDQCRNLLIVEALRRSSNCQTNAARLLGVTQQALSKWMHSKPEPEPSQP